MKKTVHSILFKGFLIVAACTLIVSGCKKAKPAEDSDTTASNENAFAQTSFNDIGNISDQASTGSTSSYKTGQNNGGLLSSCAVITSDTALRTITVDFGPTDCLCHDGRKRRGKIFISYTKPHYWDSLDVITIGFANYFVDEYGINGTKTISNLGRINGQQTYNVKVTNGSITKPNNGGNFTWNSNITRKWIQGENTPFFWFDDKYAFTGNSSGTSSGGIGYSAQIVTPLIRDMSCLIPRWFTQGILDFTPSGKAVRVMDFGNGACDDIVTITISGQVYTVHMW
jgi:hypothetical protein